VRFLRNPLVQFLLLGLLTMAVIAVGTDYLAGRSAEREALAESRRTNAVLARSVAQPYVTEGLQQSDPGSIDRFQRKILDRLVSGDVVRVNFWSADGRIVYSSSNLKTGRTYPLGPEREHVFKVGGTAVLTSDPAAPENLGVTGNRELVQIVTRFEAPDGHLLLFEGYYSLQQIEDRRVAIYSAFRWISIGGLLLLLVLVAPLLIVLSRRLSRSAEERARLLDRAIDASDAERRRIARDLHDTVVQDLAGTAFSVSALARDAATPPEARSHLNEVGASLRQSLRSLRSLLAEIYPPELSAERLGSALDDLVAPAANAGVQALVSVEGAQGAGDASVALVWRVAQEAVRNALRHANPTTLEVRVRRVGSLLTLEVSDDGIGFEPLAPAAPDSFGLRGLRSLVAEAGGTLDVTSIPSRGTTVLLEVSA
jgi:signal transduction histidine kinase